MPSWARSISRRVPSLSRSGRRTVKVLPLPSSLRSVTSPPSSLDSSRTIDSPSPVPPCSRVMGLPAWRNFSKTSSCSSGAMPTPVSVTVSTSWSDCASARSTTRPPSGVNLIAFDSRLASICWSFTASCDTGGTSAAHAPFRSMFFFSAMGRNIVSMPSQMSPMRNDDTRTCILPASILARSRTSLMRASSCCPLDWMLAAQRCCFSLRPLEVWSTSLKPRIELSGVRSSWLMVARKSLLSRLDSYSARLAWASSSTLWSRSPLTLRKRSCIVTRLRSMRLKAWLRSSNSSPVWISLRTFSSPALMASLTSLRCLIGLTIT